MMDMVAVNGVAATMMTAGGAVVKAGRVERVAKVLASPVRDLASPVRDLASPVRDPASPVRDLASLARDLASPARVDPG